jgi:hypothetical protein
VGNPDVVAVVANDLLRFHRKGFRMGQLLELYKEGHLELVKVADKKSIDVNDLTATMWVMMESLFNEYYAEDISRKQKDSVRHRRSTGITVGAYHLAPYAPKKMVKAASWNGALSVPGCFRMVQNLKELLTNRLR